jgi:hypothetical protein
MEAWNNGIGVFHKIGSSVLKDKGPGTQAVLWVIEERINT